MTSVGAARLSSSLLASLARSTSPSLARAPLCLTVLAAATSVITRASRVLYADYVSITDSAPATRLHLAPLSPPVPSRSHLARPLSRPQPVLCDRSTLLPPAPSPCESSLPLFFPCTDALSAVLPQISHIARVDRRRVADVICSCVSRIESRESCMLYPHSHVPHWELVGGLRELRYQSVYGTRCCRYDSAAASLIPRPRAPSDCFQVPFHLAAASARWRPRI